MEIRIPVEFDDIVDAIAAFSDVPAPEVVHRVWMEALDLGWNVGRDIARFGVTPHVYGPAMLRLYEESDAFVFETMVFWAKPFRQHWTGLALERIRLYAARAGLDPRHVRVLMLGDGTGNDSLCLVRDGFTVDYFEVPGSKTFQFAMARFKHHGLLDRSITVVTDYEVCLARQYDVVICFEVLEHLPQPLSSIGDMRSMLKTGGIALVTDAFDRNGASFPTHLASNARYAHRTPYLFLRRGLVLSWYSKETAFKPMEYTKVRKTSPRDLARLVADPFIGKQYVSTLLDSAEHAAGRLIGD